MNLSYTKVKCYRECPKKYQFKYINHLPEPEGIELKIGTIGHKVLEQYYMADKSERNQECLNILVRLESENETNEVKHILMEALDGYHSWASVEDEKIKIISTEKEINIKLGDYVFTGKIDAIGDMNGEPVLLEHKFKGQWGTDVAQQFQFDEQNKGYSLATGCRQILYNLIRTKPAKSRPKFERVHILVPEAEVIRFQEDLGMWNTKIEEAKRDNKFPRNRGYMCRFCPFIDECYNIEVVRENH